LPDDRFGAILAFVDHESIGSSAPIPEVRDLLRLRRAVVAPETARRIRSGHREGSAASSVRLTFPYARPEGHSRTRPSLRSRSDRCRARCQRPQGASTDGSERPMLEVAQPAMDGLLEAEEVAPARSRFSTSRTERPRPAASRAIPTPLMQPPTTNMSRISDKAASPRGFIFRFSGGVPHAISIRTGSMSDTHGAVHARGGQVEGTTFSPMAAIFT
jgi:hypothetical protein